MQQRPFRRRTGTQVHPRGHRAGPEARFSSAFLFLGEQVVGDGGDDDEALDGLDPGGVHAHDGQASGRRERRKKEWKGAMRA